MADSERISDRPRPGVAPEIDPLETRDGSWLEPIALTLRAPSPLRLAWIVVLAIGMATTTAVAFADSLPFAVESVAMHAAVEGVAASFAALAAAIMFQRFRRLRRSDELLLAIAFLLLALNNTLFRLVPAMDDGDRYDASMVWAALATTLVAYIVLTAGAIARVVRSHATVPGALALAAGGVAVIGAAAYILGDTLPLGVNPRLEQSLPEIDAAFELLATQVVLAIVVAFASVAYLLKAERRGDGFLGAMSLALALLAFANMNYALFPSLYSTWVYSGDVFRLCAYLAIGAATVREIGENGRALARAAVFDERRRVSQELHDTVAQELACILADARMLGAADEQGMEEARERVEEAARRAIANTRTAIRALTAMPDEALRRQLHELAQVAAEDTNLVVDVEVAPGLDPTGVVRDDVVRVARAAVAGALAGGARGSLRIVVGRARGYIRVSIHHGTLLEADIINRLTAGVAALGGTAEAATAGRFDLFVPDHSDARLTG